MSISVTEFYRITQIDCNQTLPSTCIWSKAISKQIEHYQLCLNNKLSAYVSTDVYCTSMEHRNEIDLLCNCIIESCVASGLHCIPLIRSCGRDMPGWTEQVVPERDRSLFWHWMWCELGKPNKGIVYDVMERARHRYQLPGVVKNKSLGALILEHVSEIMADTCNVNTRQKKNIK